MLRYRDIFPSAAEPQAHVGSGKGESLSDNDPGQGYVHAVEDISTYKAHERARKKAEEQLFEAKERAQVTLDSIGDAVLSTDMHGRVSYMNVVAETLTGYSRHEAVGNLLSDIFNVVDATTHEPMDDPARRAIQSDSIVALEANALLVAKDGTELAIEDSAAPIHNRQGGRCRGSHRVSRRPLFPRNHCPYGASCQA